MNQYWAYRLYSDDGLLYVGATTKHPEIRLSQHPFRAEVTSVVATPFATAEEALDEEARLIAELAPPYNKSVPRKGRRRSVFNSGRRGSDLLTLIELRLAAHDQTFASYVAEQRAGGVSSEHVWLGLRALTGVDVSQRTFYRWLEEMKEAS